MKAPSLSIPETPAPPQPFDAQTWLESQPEEARLAMHRLYEYVLTHPLPNEATEDEGDDDGNENEA